MNNPLPDTGALLSVDEVGTMLAASRGVVVAWLEAGELKGARPDGPGGEWRVSAQAVDDFLEMRRRADTCLL